jgi:hypothetical protein
METGMANDTAINPKKAADARTRIIDEHGDLILRAHRESSSKHPEWDVAVLLLDTDTDPIAHDAAEKLGLRLGGVRLIAVDRQDLLREISTWANGETMEALRDAPAAALKVLCIAHHGTAFLVRDPSGAVITPPRQHGAN